jgi:hypothetical protein
MKIVLSLLCSCKENKRKQTIQQVVSDWTGKEIAFPNGISCQSMGNDIACPDFSNSNYKILLYVDSAGCSSCRLKLAEWNRIIAEADSFFAGEIDFLFFFQPKKQDEKELQFMFKQQNFRHPVFIDTNNELDRLNQLPNEAEYQCFLLDKDNKVLLVGNPSINTGIWRLYKRLISESESKLTSTKREESLTFLNKPTLFPAFHLIRKEAAKITN